MDKSILLKDLIWLRKDKNQELVLLDRWIEVIDLQLKQEAMDKKLDSALLSSKKGCGRVGYIPTNNGKGMTTAICGCVNGWLCKECSSNKTTTEEKK